MSDLLSLTLPKQTSRSRVRLRKPRKPTFRELLFLSGTLVAAYGAVSDFLSGSFLWAVLDALFAGVYWWAYHRARRGVRDALPLSVCVPLLAAWLTLFVVGGWGA